MARLSRGAALLLPLLLLARPALALNPGDILVTDFNAGTNGQGALFRVDPTTGARTVVSDFGAGSNQGVDPVGVAIEASGQILVVDPAAGTNGQGALFRVDPTTGTRTVVSDFGAGSNQGVDPWYVAVEPSGQILVVDSVAGTNTHGALFRVDPTTGARTLLSDFGAGSNQGGGPRGVTVAFGDILVADWGAFANGYLFRVDPTTGARTILILHAGLYPAGVAAEVSGQILFLESGRGYLWRADPLSAAVTLLSDFHEGTNQGVEPWYVAVEPSGQILVVDYQAGTNAQGALFRVNPTTGARTVLSDFGVGDNQGVDPFAVAVVPPPAAACAPPGALVADFNAGTNGRGALFRVDLSTGVRSLVSDFNGSSQAADPVGIAVEASGQVLVADYAGGTGSRGALFRVDPTSGTLTLLSDFGAGSNQGSAPGVGVVAVEASGQILVGDAGAGTNARGALFRVDPTTGARTLLSDFGAGSNQGVVLGGVAVEASGQILEADTSAGTNARGVLFRVDPTTGARTVVTDFGIGSPLGVDPNGVAIEASGQILVADYSAGTNARGALFRVDPTTGARTLVSDFGVGSPLGVDPLGVAVEASGQILVADFNAGTNGQGVLFRVDPTTGARTLVNDFGAGSLPGSVPAGVALPVCCGDSLIAVGREQCDDGNTSAGDGCSASCAVEPGFQCSGEPSVCQPVCGDGLIRGGEQCDDHNTSSGDGCSASCTLEPGFSCSGEPSVCQPFTPTPTLTPTRTASRTPTLTRSPTATPTNTPTPSLTPTRTSSPTATATSTPTSTPTSTNTSSPSSTPTVTPVPAVDLGKGVGQPGGVACLPATLAAGSVQVAGTTNDIGFDATQLTFTSCAINPAIGGGSPANKGLTATTLGTGNERVQIGGNPNLVPDGLVYTCQFAVGAGATLGAHVLTNAPAATDPGGNSIAGIGGTAGQITVTTCTGDCNGDGTVTIGEVIRCVNLFLGEPLCNPSNPLLSCPAADATPNGVVSIGEVIQCVNGFLKGC